MPLIMSIFDRVMGFPLVLPILLLSIEKSLSVATYAVASHRPDLPPTERKYKFNLFVSSIWEIENGQSLQKVIHFGRSACFGERTQMHMKPRM